MAVADAFYFNGEWIKIHVDLKTELGKRFYVVSAKDESDSLVNGFEYRVDAMIDSDPFYIMKTPALSRLVKLARADVEEHLWEAHVESIAAFEGLYRFPTSYEDGRTAFQNKQHYNTNPHPDESDESAKWFDGWAGEFEKYPDLFNDQTQEFNKPKP